MRHIFFAILLVFFLAVSCGDGAVRVVPETSDDNNQSEKSDSEEISDSDEAENGGEDSEQPQKDDENPEKPDESSDPELADDGDTVPEEGDEDGEQINDEDENVVHDDRIVSCKDLPENAEWNTASLITQTWQNGGYAPSESGTYSKEPAPSTTEVTYPEAAELSPQPCPEDTAPQNDRCVECRRIISANFIEETDAGTAFIDGTTQKAIEECHAQYEIKEDGKVVFTDFGKTCCGSGPLYRFKNKELVELTPPYTYNGQPIPNEVMGCAEGFERVEDKCYECLDKLTFDGEKYQCSTEIGTECRFKCKETFEWNEDESVCEPLE